MRLKDPAVVRTCGVVLGYVLRRCHSPDDAADVVAETFTIAWRRAGELPPRDEVRLWLYGVARRALANHLRGERRHSIKTAMPHDELAAAPPAAPAPPENTAVARVFGDLPDRDRELLGLVAWGGLGNAEIAKVLGCSRNAVSIRRNGGPGRPVGTDGSRPPPSRRPRWPCPLTVQVSGKAVRQGSTKILIGRAARPGEPYRFQPPAAGDHPPSLRLTGRTVAEALSRLHKRNLTAVYVLGRFHKDGSGSDYAPPAAWRPQGDRRVTGAWMHGSNAVALLIAPVKGDPAPDPNAPGRPG